MTEYLWIPALAFFAFWIWRSRGPSAATLKALVDRGAQKVDVRSPGEYGGAHAPGSVNIPLDQLGSRLHELDSTRPVLLCCASGTRSAMAASLLRRKGFEAVNAGPWTRLRDLG